MSTINTIDFSTLGGPVFSGRERGASMRKSLELDKLDATNGIIKVKIDESIFTISSSFFLAMFGASIKHAGSREAFLKKYVFDVPERMWLTIDRSINRVMHNL